MKRLALSLVLFFGFSSAALADVAENYAKGCATCHGKTGDGKTKMGEKLGLKPLAEGIKGKSDADIEKALTDGVKKDGKEVMKSAKEKFNDAEIKELVGFVKTLK